MNCILVLLLLGCCGGWGNGNGCDCCAVPYDNCDCRRGARRESCDGRNSGFGNPDRRNHGRRPDGCGCEKVPPVRESSDCGCGQNDREDNGPGLIPPPWQDYPKFSHHDNCDDCES